MTKSRINDSIDDKKKDERESDKWSERTEDVWN